MTSYFIASLAGYVLGRVGHIIGGNIWWIPHHWILGAIIMAIPLFFKKSSANFKMIVFLFGLGVFASDFKDFLDLKVFESEDVNVVKFWGID
jgi:hypothetical protein